MNRRAMIGAIPALALLFGRQALASPEPLDSSGYDAGGHPYRLDANDVEARNVSAVYCDGKKLRSCYRFDRLEGWALCHKTVKEVCDDATITGLKSVKHTGRITVEWKSDWDHLTVGNA